VPVAKATTLAEVRQWSRSGPAFIFNSGIVLRLAQTRVNSRGSIDASEYTRCIGDIDALFENLQGNVLNQAVISALILTVGVSLSIIEVSPPFDVGASVFWMACVRTPRSLDPHTMHPRRSVALNGSHRAPCCSRWGRRRANAHAKQRVLLG
jgi:hypothetical protein